jgi:hypothetical protein
MVPLKDYEDLCRRWHKSFSYPFVCERFDFTMPELAAYTAFLLGGDARGRYNDYASQLIDTILELDGAGVQRVQDLMAKVGSREQLQRFAGESGVPAPEIVTVLKYLIYWVLPREKPLGGLVGNNPFLSEAIGALREAGIRTNLDLLQHGLTPAGRRDLAERSGLPEALVLELVHRADLSRMPWASKATISNITGAGYGSLARLANADPGQLYDDFFRYGERLGKNLKHGNEIENSYRIARIVPVLLKEEPHTGGEAGTEGTTAA